MWRFKARWRKKERNEEKDIENRQLGEDKLRIFKEKMKDAKVGSMEEEGVDTLLEKFK